MEEVTHTSSKGQSDRSQPNNQTIESPLKKFKKKSKKLPIAQRVSNSTKTRVAQAKMKAIKAKLGRLKLYHMIGMHHFFKSG